MDSPACARGNLVLTVGRLQSSIRSRSTLMGPQNTPQSLNALNWSDVFVGFGRSSVSYRFAITSLPSQLIRLALYAIMPPEPACDYTYSPSP